MLFYKKISDCFTLPCTFQSSLEDENEGQKLITTVSKRKVKISKPQTYFKTPMIELSLSKRE